MKYHLFHATLADLTPKLRLIEERFQLKYIPMGWQQSPSGDVYTSVFDIPNLGVAKSDQFRLNDGIRCEYNVPEALFQVIGRNRTALDGVNGIAQYMPEFEIVS